MPSTEGDYLVRSARMPRGRDVIQAPEFGAAYKAKQRTKRITTLGGMSFREVEHAGWVKSELVIWADTKIAAHAGGRTVKRTAEGIKSVIRKLRAEEKARLLEVDKEIEAARQILADLRHQRQLILQEAFTKGHVVRLAEVESRVKQ